MLSSYLIDPDLQAYFLIYKSSQGCNPIAQQWALEKVMLGLEPYVQRLAGLILGRIAPIGKTERYIASHGIKKIRADLIQDIYLCILHVLRKQKLYETDRLYDYMYLMIRELFGGKATSLN